MPMEEKRRSEGPNTLILENRSRLSLTGVTDVGSFDEETALVETGLGTLVIRGSGLHMERLSLETGEVTVAGNVDALEYHAARGKSGLLGRLFR